MGIRREVLFLRQVLQQQGAQHCQTRTCAALGVRRGKRGGCEGRRERNVLRRKKEEGAEAEGRIVVVETTGCCGDRVL